MIQTLPMEKAVRKKVMENIRLDIRSMTLMTNGFPM